MTAISLAHVPIIRSDRRMLPAPRDELGQSRPLSRGDKALAGPARASLASRGRRSAPLTYLVTLKSAEWLVPSASISVNLRQVPAHALSVFQV